MTYTNRGFPAGNPIANALVIIAGTLMIAASLVIGFFAFVVLGSAFLILAAVVGIRVWWLRRKMQNAARQGRGASGEPHATMIEGEYTVVVNEKRRSTGDTERD